jgi:energy-coupling factor transporter ATP-binding protein EcfA2
MRAIATNLAGRRGDNVLFDIGLFLTRGEALVITGPNGAGKSTLLRVMAGLLAADSGHFALHGEDGAVLPVSEHSHYLGHRNAMKRELKVSENLDFWKRFQAGQRRGAERRRSDRGRSGSPAWRICRSAICRPASSGASRWRGCWSRAGRCGCSMSRRRRSTSAPTAVCRSGARASGGWRHGDRRHPPAAGARECPVAGAVGHSQRGADGEIWA